MANDNILFLSDYYSKDFECTNEAILELKLFINEIPNILARAPIGRLEETMNEIQYQLNKLLSQIHNNLAGFKNHFDQIVDMNEVLNEKLRTGRFFKGSPKGRE
jgi:hypothetical protein